MKTYVYIKYMYVHVCIYVYIWKSVTLQQSSMSCSILWKILISRMPGWVMDQERSLVFSVLNALWCSEFIDFRVKSSDILNTAHLKNAIRTFLVISWVLDSITCWGFLSLTKSVCLLWIHIEHPLAKPNIVHSKRLWPVAKGLGIFQQKCNIFH